MAGSNSNACIVRRSRRLRIRRLGFSMLDFRNFGCKRPLGHKFGLVSCFKSKVLQIPPQECRSEIRCKFAKGVFSTSRRHILKFGFLVVGSWLATKIDISHGAFSHMLPLCFGVHQEFCRIFEAVFSTPFRKLVDLEQF